MVAQELAGPVVRASSDSVTLEVWDGRDASGASLARMPGRQATLARRSDVHVEVRAFDARSTRNAGIAVALVIGLAGLVLYLLGSAVN